MKRFTPVIFVGLAIALIAGCRGGPAVKDPTTINPPTEPFEKVVASINANNAKVPTLWARQSFEATIVDKVKNKRSEVVGDGALLYKRPNGFLLGHPSRDGTVHDGQRRRALLADAQPGRRHDVVGEG